MGIFFNKEIQNINEIYNELDNFIFIVEAGRKISTTKYKCPFCDYHATKDKLVTHIEKVHPDMIPKGFTGSRVLFNAFNHKDHSNCIICGRETKWNESTWRYERLCGRKSCHDKYVKQMQDNMLKKYGKKNLLGDPEHQKKMLSNRSISGKYLFRDGHYKEYVGSYEKKLLEFLDKVLEVNSQDIYSPGPVIDYEYNGEKHKYISDFFYDPFNLIIEVKDGGDNPNTRDMKSYREKQLAKENAIKKLNKYNYIRLTNNNFQQLIATMLKIKEQLSENSNTSETIIDINEVGVAGAPIAGAMPRGNAPEAYIVPCFMNNIYSGSIISTDKFLKNIYRVQDDEIKKDNMNYLYNYDYDVYKIVKNNDKISDIINAKGKIKNKKDFLYSTITGKDLLDPRQFEYEECFEKVEDPYLDKWNNIVNISESIRYQFNILNNRNFDMNIINEQVLSKKKEKLSNYKKVDIKQDINGYFLCNTVTNCRTQSYKDIESIPESQYNNIENMKL